MKHLKHLLALLLALALCAALLPAALAEDAGTIAPAEEPGAIAPAADDLEEVYSGTCGDNLTWSLDTDTGVLKISGTGNMYNYSIQGAPWYKYSAKITSIELSEGLTRIGNAAFLECYITSVTIPESVTSIGERAFLYCWYLTSLSLPEGLTSIESLAFTGCRKLTGVTIPASVTSIGEAPFSECTSLPTIEVAEGNQAFCSRDGILYAKDLTRLIQCPGRKSGEVTVPAAVTSVGSSAFAFCSDLTSVRFEGSAPNFGSFAFHEDTMTVYYPGDDPSWTAEVRKDYSGKITWTPVYPDVFSDVKEGKFYYYPVMWAFYHDPRITAGIDATHFAPDKTCTRSQIVSFLWRAAGMPEPVTTKNPFTDVKEGQFYYKAVLWAYEEGITSGLTDTTFGPNRSCTRAQVVSFLWRFAGSPKPSNDNNPFDDVDSEKYYYKAVLWAAEKKITSGLTPTTFGPVITCTRGQIVTFLYNYMGV